MIRVGHRFGPKLACHDSVHGDRPPTDMAGRSVSGTGVWLVLLTFEDTQSSEQKTQCRKVFQACNMVNIQKNLNVQPCFFRWQWCYYLFQVLPFSSCKMSQFRLALRSSQRHEEQRRKFCETSEARRSAEQHVRLSCQLTGKYSSSLQPQADCGSAGSNSLFYDNTDLISTLCKKNAELCKVK